MNLRLSGLLANRPNPNAAVSAFYFATDDGKVYESDGDSWFVRETLDHENIAGHLSGTLAARPPAGAALGYIYHATDTGLSYEGFPTAWAQLYRNAFGYHLKFGDAGFMDREIGRITATPESPVFVEIFPVLRMPFDGSGYMVKLMTADLDGGNPVAVVCFTDSFQCDAPNGGGILTSNRKFTLSYTPASGATDDVLLDGIIATDTSLRSPSANFVTSDIGKVVSGTGIAAGATIVSRQAADHVTLSAPTTASATGRTVTIHGRIPPSAGDLYIIIRFATIGLTNN